MTDLHEARRLRAELDSIGRLIEHLDLGRLKAITDTLAEHDRLIGDTRRRLDELETR